MPTGLQQYNRDVCLTQSPLEIDNSHIELQSLFWNSVHRGAK